MTTPSLLSSNEMKNLDDPERYPNSHVDAKWESDYRAVDDDAHRHSSGVDVLIYPNSNQTGRAQERRAGTNLPINLHCRLLFADAL